MIQQRGKRGLRIERRRGREREEERVRRKKTPTPSFLDSPTPHPQLIAPQSPFFPAAPSFVLPFYFDLCRRRLRLRRRMRFLRHCEFFFFF